MKDPESILIVLTGSVGDVTRALPIVGWLRRSFPKARLGWLVEALSAPLVEGHPALTELFVFHRSQGIGGVPELIRKLRAAPYEVVLDLQRIAKSALFSWATGAPRRIGWHRSLSKEGNWLFCTETTPPADPHIPKLEHYRAFVHQLGGSTATEPWYGFTVQTPPARFGLPAHGGCTVVLGSNWASKDWPAEGYRGLMTELLARNIAPIVLVGMFSHHALGEELRGIDPRIVNLAGKTSLRELIDILGWSRVAVGPDSGPGHIAAAVGTPYFALFGPTDPNRTAPQGMQDLVIQGQVPCAPCYRRSCPGLGGICMRLIHPAVVAERILEVWQGEGGVGRDT